MCPVISQKRRNAATSGVGHRTRQYPEEILRSFLSQVKNEVTRGHRRKMFVFTLIVYSEIIFDPEKIEERFKRRCSQLVNARRMIYNLTSKQCSIITFQLCVGMKIL